MEICSAPLGPEDKQDNVISYGVGLMRTVCSFLEFLFATVYKGNLFLTHLSSRQEIGVGLRRFKGRDAENGFKGKRHLWSPVVWS